MKFNIEKQENNYFYLKSGFTLLIVNFFKQEDY